MKHSLLSYKNKIIVSAFLLQALLGFQDIHGENIQAHDHQSQTVRQPSAQEMKSMLAQAEGILQATNQETLHIESCLTQIEQMLNANKIRLAQPSAKGKILKEIKWIRLMIQAEFKQFSNALNVEEGIAEMALLNRSLLKYLLPIVQSDITKLDAQQFSACLTEKGQDITQDMSLDQILADNAEKTAILTKATDVVGLTTFNKLYRAFQDKKIFMDASAQECGLNTIKYGALLAGFCALGIYLHPNQKFCPEGKAIIGDARRTLQVLANPAIDLEDSGLVDQIAQLVSVAGNNVIVTSAMTVFLSQLKKPFDMLVKSCWQKCSQLNSYLRGDVETTNNRSDKAHRIQFSDIVGGEHLKELAFELADFIQFPERYQRTNTSPSTGFLLAGPPQTGKTHFVHALQTLINDQCKANNTRCKIMHVTQETINDFESIAASLGSGKSGYDLLFEQAQRNAPYILFFDELDMFQVNRNKDSKATGTLLTNMTKIHEDKTRPVIVIGATNRIETLDEALLQNGRFGKIIHFTYPNQQDRYTYLHKMIRKANIDLSDEYIHTIALETSNCSFNTLTEVVKAAIRRAKYQGRPATEADFKFALDREVRKICPHITLSPEEKKVIALYHAGQVVARNLLQTSDQVVKVTINPVEKPIRFKEGYAMRSADTKDSSDNHELLPQSRPNPLRLGHVFTSNNDSSKELISNTHQEKEMLALLSGQAALELVTGQRYDQFGKEDRAVVVQGLEKQVSEGAFISDKMREEAIARKNALEAAAKNTLQPHISLITTIADKLVAQNTMSKDELTSITDQHMAHQQSLQEGFLSKTFKQAYNFMQRA